MRKRWNIFFEDGRHWVELSHGFFSGKRSILVDGKQIIQEKKFFDNGSEHDFTISGHALKIIISELLFVRYHLYNFYDRALTHTLLR